jgi:uncharacterized protein (UPF0276 family)
MSLCSFKKVALAGSRAGIGLRAQHHRDIIEHRPAVGWLEAHSENYFAHGGPQRRVLEKIRALYPISLHGVGLSIGSTDPLDRTHLGELSRLIRDYEPALVSEHLSWSSVGGRFMNDLVPLPYTEEALWHLVARVRAVQEELGRQILIENVSSYLRFTLSTLTEWDFLAALVRESGCGVLLDVNNLYVNAMNHGFDVCEYLEGIPRESVQEIHLAGHSVNRVGTCEIRIDTHGSRVCEAVWDVYRAALRRFGHVPTLIEWDTDIPALEVLVEEADKADRIAEGCHAVAA